ncbi:MAG: hypothetical protein ACOXZV_00670 [Bacteroidales bacterium]|jgi:hypothetical protein
MKNKRPFVGHIISDRPVTVQEAKKAGLIKKDPEDKEQKNKRNGKERY